MTVRCRWAHGLSSMPSTYALSTGYGVQKLRTRGICSHNNTLLDHGRTRVGKLATSYQITQPSTALRPLSTSFPHHESTPNQHSEHHSQVPLVRNLMRLVPHPVAVITSTDPTPSQPGDSWRGATVSSFNTVTFTPSPIISFNIKRQSATFTAIANSRLFNVHLLNEGSESERIAGKFASGNEGRPFHDGDSKIEGFVRREEEKDRRKPPVLGSGGVTAFRLACEHVQDKTVDIGDHVVVFGRVIEVEEFESSPSRPCLVYVDRKYGRVT